MSFVISGALRGCNKITNHRDITPLLLLYVITCHSRDYWQFFRSLAFTKSWFCKIKNSAAFLVSDVF